MKTRRRMTPKLCACCGERNAWEANRLPVCEPCFDRASTTAKLDFWRELDRAVLAADVQAAVRAARAMLIRAIRVGG